MFEVPKKSVTASQKLFYEHCKTTMLDCRAMLDLLTSKGVEVSQAKQSFLFAYINIAMDWRGFVPQFNGTTQYSLCTAKPLIISRCCDVHNGAHYSAEMALLFGPEPWPVALRVPSCPLAGCFYSVRRAVIMGWDFDSSVLLRESPDKFGFVTFATYKFRAGLQSRG